MKLLKDLRSVLNLTVIIAGLGYFVDLFDITLFGVVRVQSVLELTNFDQTNLLKFSVQIYNAQMIGLMLGGILWGIIADKKGRLSVMFGSIILYSLANIANGYVTTIDQYIICRFLGGLGLAGELGAAITLVAESLPKEKRGLGTTIVAFLGMLGIVAAAIFGQSVHWRTAYIVGGIMGLALLFARFKISESLVFEKVKKSAERGNILVLFKKDRWLRYLCCILVGVPVYFATGVLWTFAPELTAGLGVKGTVTAGNTILFGSIGLTIGDLLSGLISQKIKSRRKTVALMICVGFLFLLIYCFSRGLTPKMVYALSLGLGVCLGYWAVLVTMAAEQFGTNIRGTVATTVPNFVRGSAIFAVIGFSHLRPAVGASNAALIVGTVCFGLALISLSQLEETFSRDLNYQDK